MTAEQLRVNTEHSDLELQKISKDRVSSQLQRHQGSLDELRSVSEPPAAIF